MGIGVVSEISVYELAGKEAEAGNSWPTILVRSHWNRREMAVIEVAGQKYTVSITDLQAALENAGNAKQHL